MARWIPTKRQKYGVGECLPRPTLTRAPLSPLWPRGTGAHSATRSCCCSPGRLARSGVKVLLGSGTLILPIRTPTLVAHTVGTRRVPTAVGGQRGPHVGWCALRVPSPTSHSEAPKSLSFLLWDCSPERRHRQNGKPNLPVEVKKRQKVCGVGRRARGSYGRV